MSLRAAHIVVSGFVQGVGFRFFAARKAEAFGLTGFVRNLADGSVEVVARGERGRVEALIGELKIGPRSSHVASVRVEWMTPDEVYDGFVIR